MKIAIIDFATFKAGGIPSFGYHLAETLKTDGHKTLIFSTNKKIYGVKKLKLTKEYAKRFNVMFDRIIINGTFRDKKKDKEIKKFLSYLHRPLYLVIHDPAEEGEFFLQFKIKKIVTVSQTDLVALKNKYHAYKVPIEYLIHPYVRWHKDKRYPEGNRLLATARVDFDKHYEQILKLVYRTKTQLNICTSHINRLYDYFKLKDDFPHWKEDYLKGGFAYNQEGYDAVYLRNDIYIDLSFIKNGGSRSQYTFLEAFDYGLPVILSKKWDEKGLYWINGENGLLIDPDSIEEFEKALFFLANTKNRRKMIDNGYLTLEKHSPENTLPRIKTVFEVN